MSWRAEEITRTFGPEIPPAFAEPPPEATAGSEPATRATVRAKSAREALLRDWSRDEAEFRLWFERAFERAMDPPLVRAWRRT